MENDSLKNYYFWNIFSLHNYLIMGGGVTQQFGGFRIGNHQTACYLTSGIHF